MTSTRRKLLVVRASISLALFYRSNVYRNQTISLRQTLLDRARELLDITLRSYDSVIREFLNLLKTCRSQHQSLVLPMEEEHPDERIPGPPLGPPSIRPGPTPPSSIASEREYLGPMTRSRTALLEGRGARGRGHL